MVNEDQATLFKVDENKHVTKNVKLSDIVIPKYDPADFMKDSVETMGIINDPILRKKGNKHIIIDGRRRIISAKLAGKTSIQAKVYTEISNAHSSMITLSANYARSNNPISELEALEQLDKSKITMDTIRKYLNVSKNQAKELKRLLDLPQNLYKALKEGKISWTLAKKIVRLSIKMQKKISNEYQKEGKITGKRIDEMNKIDKDRLAEVIRPELFELPDSRDYEIENIISTVSEWNKKDKKTLIAKLEENL